MNPNIEERIKQLAAKVFDKVVDYRCHLHAHPELSYKEYNTMQFVADRLNELGIDNSVGVGETGVVGIIKGAHHSSTDKAIGLRADLDALPIHEENEVPYRSKFEGIMHACGHDVHTAILLGTAEVLHELRNELPYPVKLIFQPGEEKNPGGATYMIRDGALKSPDVMKMYALHVFPDMETGNVGFKEGIYMASCDEIYITIHGKGGHGATPNNCIDPILIGANLLTTLQQIVSRKCDPKIPCVLSFGHFEAIGATNVIPSQAHLKGTFRTMNEAWRTEAHELITRTVEGVVSANGGAVDLIIDRGYPYLENDPTTTAQLREAAKSFLGEEKVEELPIRLTAEDFSYYSQEVPVCFFRLGVRNEEQGIVYGVHHPKFNIDENALETGVQMMSLAAFMQ